MNSDVSVVFGFESDLERNLECIPMSVRFKLDKCGVKLSLEQWRLLSEGDRRDLLDWQCDTEHDLTGFRRALELSVKASNGDDLRTLKVETRPLWDEPDVPVQLTRKAIELGTVAPTSSEWRGLTPLQRFVLTKLSRDGDHHRNLVPALREFNLRA